MIKISKSKMHRFSTLFLLKGTGSSHDKSASFLFKETHSLFGDENLASNVVEYDDEVELVNFFKSSQGAQLLEELNLEFAVPLNIIDTQVSQTKDFDFRLQTFDKKLHPMIVQLLKNLFAERLKLRLQVISSSDTQALFKVPALMGMSFCRLFVSRDFVENGRHQLSEIYKPLFSGRYVDSQVPFIEISPLFAGITEGLQS